MKTIAERLKWARERSGRSQMAVARLVREAYPGTIHGPRPAGIQQIISRMEGGADVHSQYLPYIAFVLGVRCRWLMTGEPPIQDTSYEHEQHVVPMATWDIPARPPEGESPATVVSPVPCGPTSFALVVPEYDDSLGHEISRGEILIVDPGVKATHTAMVIVQNIPTQEVSCRQIVSDGVRWHLRPPNPTYPGYLMNPKIRICGVAVAKIKLYGQSARGYTASVGAAGGAPVKLLRKSPEDEDPKGTRATPIQGYRGAKPRKGRTKPRRSSSH
ncbi:MAG: S24 family peptidase [Acidiferrobacteraceae bacterium]